MAPTLAQRRRRSDKRRVARVIPRGRRELLKRGTHEPQKHVVGLHTSGAWEALCHGVTKLKLTPCEAL